MKQVYFYQIFYLNYYFMTYFLSYCTYLSKYSTRLQTTPLVVNKQIVSCFFMSLFISLHMYHCVCTVINHKYKQQQHTYNNLRTRYHVCSPIECRSICSTDRPSTWSYCPSHLHNEKICLNVCVQKNLHIKSTTHTKRIHTYMYSHVRPTPILPWTL